MATERLNVTEFAAKVDLVLGMHESIKSRSRLASEIGLASDYLSRILNGTRALNKGHLDSISSALSVDPTWWNYSLEDFAKKLGAPLSVPIATFDFEARLRDPKDLRRLFDLIGGFWESYYFSVTNSTELVASRDLVFIGAPTPDDVLPVTVVDKFFEYRGWCFPVAHHLYMFLEKQKFFNEVIVYMLNRPNRTPPALDGLILCKSDGDDGYSSVPSAARVAFRFLGIPEDLMQKEGVNNVDALRAGLQQRIPAYVTPSSSDPPDLAAIFERIRNTVTPNELPLALRAARR